MRMLDFENWKIVWFIYEIDFLVKNNKIIIILAFMMKFENMPAKGQVHTQARATQARIGSYGTCILPGFTVGAPASYATCDILYIMIYIMI